MDQRDAQTGLRDKSTKAETEVRTEVLNLYATVYITILVYRNLVVANLYAIFLTLSSKVLQLVAVSRNL